MCVHIYLSLYICICSVIKFYIMLYHIILYYITLYCIVLYYIILYDIGEAGDPCWVPPRAGLDAGHRAAVQVEEDHPASHEVRPLQEA